MTFDNAVASTWGEALADLRDKVAGMNNWSIEDDSSGGANSLSRGDWFVLSTPTGEDIRVQVTNDQTFGYSGIRVSYGPAWDKTNDNWSDQYGNDPRSKYLNGTGQYSVQDSIAPLDPADDRNALGMGDNVTYWMAYSDAVGFCFYVERTQGDGNDGDLALGFAEVNQTWDYSTASSRESDYAILYAGARHERRDYNERFGRSIDVYGLVASGGDQNNTGFGLVNPDSNYANYPLTDSLVRSSKYRNSNSQNAIIGTHDLYLDDRSGNDSAHRDTVQDDSGANLYTILKATGRSVAIKMV